MSASRYSQHWIHTPVQPVGATAPEWSVFTFWWKKLVGGNTAEWRCGGCGGAGSGDWSTGYGHALLRIRMRKKSSTLDEFFIQCIHSIQWFIHQIKPTNSIKPIKSINPMWIVLSTGYDPGQISGFLNMLTLSKGMNLNESLIHCYDP